MTDSSRKRADEKPPILVMDSGKSQFGLKSLFIAVTVFAILLALFRAFGVFGALLSFIAAIVISWVIFSWRLESRRFLFAFIWVICMPTVCLVFDPILFFDRGISALDGSSNGSHEFWNPGWRLNRLGIFAVPAILLQITAMLAWLMFGRYLRRGAHAFVGMFRVGMLVSYVIGICIFPIALFGIFFFGVGLMGFTPLFTATAYQFAIKDAIVKTKDCEFKRPNTGWKLILTGAACAVALPIGISFLIQKFLSI